ncbi:MAG: shikimate dehydrogenase [Rhizobiales bacterium]|nr:shikimate dehydrogenase [Hyphomicrobiales bacterium]
MAETVKAFVCGHPIAHSRSPKIHGYWLKTYGIAGSYEAVDIAPEDFAAFAASLRERGYTGGNVTLPNKEAAFAAAMWRDDAAVAIGAANTLWFEDDRLCAGNTDAYGFAANLDDRAPGWERGKTAVVLGAGGSSRAVIHALKVRGFTDIRVVNRTVARAAELARHFGEGVAAHGLFALSEVLSDADLVVNTTSLGMKGEGELPADPGLIAQNAIVTDLVYVPLMTPFLAAAAAQGLKTVDGLGMLLHQAVPGFERWFGARPEVTAELRDRIVADLGAA